MLSVVGKIRGYWCQSLHSSSELSYYQVLLTMWFDYCASKIVEPDITTFAVWSCKYHHYLYEIRNTTNAQIHHYRRYKSSRQTVGQPPHTTWQIGVGLRWLRRATCIPWRSVPGYSANSEKDKHRSTANRNKASGRPQIGTRFRSWGEDVVSESENDLRVPLPPEGFWTIIFAWYLGVEAGRKSGVRWVYETSPGTIVGTQPSWQRHLVGGLVVLVVLLALSCDVIFRDIVATGLQLHRGVRFPDWAGQRAEEENLKREESESSERRIMGVFHRDTAKQQQRQIREHNQLCPRSRAVFTMRKPGWAETMAK